MRSRLTQRSWAFSGEAVLSSMMGAVEAAPAPGVPAALVEAPAPHVLPWRWACWTLAAAGGTAPGLGCWAYLPGQLGST